MRVCVGENERERGREGDVLSWFAGRGWPECVLSALQRHPGELFPLGR